MMPTLQDGDYVALLSNLFMGDLEQGDVIVARKESFENGEPIVKRVIATEGQTVDILYDGNGYGTVYVDGEPLDEPYILEPMVLPYYDRTSFPVTVDEGCQPLCLHWADRGITGHRQGAVHSVPRLRREQLAGLWTDRSGGQWMNA